MATVGIDPNTFEVLNGHPNKIPTDKILGGVVQNCPDSNIINAESAVYFTWSSFVVSVGNLDILIALKCGVEWWWRL